MPDGVVSTILPSPPLTVSTSPPGAMARPSGALSFPCLITVADAPEEGEPVRVRGLLTRPGAACHRDCGARGRERPPGASSAVATQNRAAAAPGVTSTCCAARPSPCAAIASRSEARRRDPPQHSSRSSTSRSRPRSLSLRSGAPSRNVAIRPATMAVSALSVARRRSGLRLGQSPRIVLARADILMSRRLWPHHARLLELPDRRGIEVAQPRGPTRRCATRPPPTQTGCCTPVWRRWRSWGSARW
jgi:hypothetical protein